MKAIDLLGLKIVESDLELMKLAGIGASTIHKELCEKGCYEKASRYEYIQDELVHLQLMIITKDGIDNE